MFDREIWKTIPEYPGYEVSSHGNFRSYKRNRGFKPLTPYIQSGSKAGYCRYYFFKDRVRKCVSGHILVARIFIPNPGNLPEVNHIDNVRTNNHYKNLEWTTRKGNCEHAAKQNRYNIAKGENSQNSKLTTKQVISIRKSSKKCVDLAAEHGVDFTTISDIRRRKTWKHV